MEESRGGDRQPINRSITFFSADFWLLDFSEPDRARPLASAPNKRDRQGPFKLGAQPATADYRSRRHTTSSLLTLYAYLALS
jgi:hypothetical protein